jgi:LCP family protein required for cell wall assembly
MGKHSQGRPPVGPGVPGRRRGPDDGKRRVPAERRRTPGEAATAGAARSGDESYRLSDPQTRRRGSLEAAPARLRVERDRRRARAKRIAIVVAGVLAALLVFGAAGVFAYAKHIEQTMQGTVVQKQAISAVLTPAKPMEPYNVLLLGVDRRPGEKAYRTDTMIVAHIDPQQKKVWMLSLPRDTKVAIPGHGERKINDAHFFGGPELTVKTVQNFTGLKINHYMEVNFAAFQKAVDALGGVWVNVPRAINDKKADRSPNHRAAKIDAGYQKLDGEHALTFVRSRDYIDADWSRMKNQQLFFKALADTMAKTSSVAKIPSVISAVSPQIVTDMSLVDMIRTAQSLKDAGGSNVYTATATGTWKTPYVYPDMARLKHLVADIKAGRSFEPTKATTPTESVGPGSTPVSAATKKPGQITVSVNNGSGISGAAKQASSILKAQGFQVPTVGNANQNVYAKTLIVYKTDIGPAQVAATYLPPGTKLVQSRGMYAFNTDVLLIVGKDWSVAKVPAAPVKTQ